MHCVSCECLISNALNDLPGVREVEVSLKSAKAAVRLSDDAKEPDLNLINDQLSAHGYILYPDGCEMPGNLLPYKKRLIRAVVALLCVLLFVAVFGSFRNSLPSISVGASFGAVFLFGLLASVSSCLATTGGFMLAYSAETKSRRKTVLMHTGRLVTFVLGGALLGAIGNLLPTYSPAWYGLFALVLGVGFVVVALNMLDLAPSLSKLGIRFPSGAHSLADKLRKRPGSIVPFAVGALTFILPCGFTQTAQALALASSSWIRGAYIMLAFALGTLPVLLGLTSLAANAVLKNRALKLAAGAVMFLFALMQINSGLTIFGVTLPSINSKISTTQTTSQDSDSNIQVIKMEVTSTGYSPSAFTLKKGIPVRWEIDAKDLSGCNQTLVSRELNISKNLTKGANVINFTPEKIGTIAFSCSMGMIRGSFKVI